MKLDEAVRKQPRGSDGRPDPYVIEADSHEPTLVDKCLLAIDEYQRTPKAVSDSIRRIMFGNQGASGIGHGYRETLADIGRRPEKNHRTIAVEAGQRADDSEIIDNCRSS